MEPVPAQPLFTVAEAADLLPISKKTLYRQIAAGKIPATQVVADLGVLRIRRGYLCHVLGVEDAPVAVAS